MRNLKTLYKYRKWITILFSSTVLLFLSMNYPSIFVKNKFFMQLMGPSLVSILVVILTITFGSVANMHISIRKLINSSKNKQKIRIIAGKARKSINSDAWVLFGIFIVVLLLLSFFGFFENEKIKSFLISICIICISYNILIMYDIYSAILMLASVDFPEEDQEDNIDFTKKQPPC